MNLSTEIFENVNAGNIDLLTVKQIVYLYSSYRVIDNETGDILRIATQKESGDNANQLQENRNNGIEIEGPNMALEIAELLVSIGAYVNTFNALDKVFQIQDSLAVEDSTFCGEKDNVYLAQCLKIHSYLVKTGQEIKNTVGSGKWLKEIELTKKEVLEF